MPFRRVLVAIFVVALWGINFIFIKTALDEVPPFTLAVLRFFFVAFPAVFFLPRPQAPWRALIVYGATNFALQFGFLFAGMKFGMSAGLTSMIMQVQVFFTMALAAVFFRERPGWIKIFGALIAFAGVALVSLHSDQDVNLLGLVLILCAAFSWACGNVASKALGQVNPLALVVWGGLVAWPFLTLFAWIAEGPAATFAVFRGVGMGTVISIAYIVVISTHLGYSLWSWLLRDHGASTVAPFALLVPVFGFLSSAMFLGEQVSDWKIHAGLLVVAGLLVNLYGSRKASRKVSPR